MPIADRRFVGKIILTILTDFPGQPLPICTIIFFRLSGTKVIINNKVKGVAGGVELKIAIRVLFCGKKIKKFSIF